jgi:hypothetical protein
MGSKTIYVDDDESIRIKNISFDLLTNIDLQTNLIEHIDPIYKIQLRLKPIFNRLNIDNKNQVKNTSNFLTSLLYFLVWAIERYCNIFR